MENLECQNNPDQPEQTIFYECDHVQATELQITSLLFRYITNGSVACPTLLGHAAHYLESWYHTKKLFNNNYSIPVRGRFKGFDWGITTRLVVIPHAGNL